MKKLLTLMMGFSLVGLSTLSFAAGNIDSGRLLAASCTACHGPDGNSQTNAFPKIAGQNERYLRKELLEMQKGPNGKRYGRLMYPVIKSLSPQDIDDLSAYFASKSMTPGKADPTLVKQGEKLFRGGNMQTHVPACSACHGPTGQGNNQAGFAKLSGQYPEYLVKQLNEYANGTRKDGVADMMSDISKLLTPAEIQAVSSYAYGLGAG